MCVNNMTKRKEVQGLYVTMQREEVQNSCV